MTEYNTFQFEKDLDALGIVLTKGQMEQFLLYYEMLLEWNEKINLTAITEYEDVMKKHFVDSLSLVKAYDVSRQAEVIDVGTGAGFPGLALKIAFPHLHVTLLDSLNKRIQFLNEVIEKLGLTGVEAIHGRAEDFARPVKVSRLDSSVSDPSGSKPVVSGSFASESSLREKFDLCVSRAVANLSTLSEYCLPFVKVGGQFISYKSEKVTEEAEAAKKAISLLGGKIVDQVEFQLPDSDIYRSLLVVEKIENTKAKYPRKAGLPGKEPL